MPYREFRKRCKGKIVSVRDHNQFYSLEQELENADREVEKITNEEDGVSVLLVKDDSICHDNVIRVYDTKRLSTNEAVKPM